MTRDGVVREFNDGWNALVDQLENDLDRVVPGWTLLQAKEKFGGLRFYIETPQEWGSTERDAASKLIAETESASTKTCELCGRPGQTLGRRWLVTLCNTHYYERVAASRKMGFDL